MANGDPLTAARIDSSSGNTMDRGFEPPRRHRMLAFLVALLPCISGLKRGLLIPGIRPAELLTLALLLWAAVTLSKARVNTRIMTAVYLYAAVYMAIRCLHLIMDGQLRIGALFDDTMGPAILLATVLTVGLIASRFDILLDTSRYLLLLGATMGVFGLLQAVGVQWALRVASALTGSDRIVQPLEWRVPRSIGLFYSWHAFGSFSAACLILLVAMMCSSVRLYQSNTTTVAVMIGIVCGLVSARTFAPILMACVAIALILIYKKYVRIKYVVIVAAASFLTLTYTGVGTFLGARLTEQREPGSILPQTIQFRIRVWQRDYFPLVDENWLIGYGPVRDSDSVFSYFESMYVFLLVTSGVLGLLAFLAMLAMVIREAWITSLNYSGALHAVSLSTFVLLIILIPMMLIHPYLHDVGASRLLYVLIGLMCGTATWAISASRNKSEKSGHV